MAELTQIFERLVAAGIQLLPLPDLDRYFAFERGGFVALVEKRDGGFGPIGNAGLLTEKGLAFLIQRGEGHLFVAKGYEQPATPEQVVEIRRFSRDLASALAG